MSLKQYRTLQGMALLVLSAGLSGCVSFDVAVSQDKYKEPLRRFQAYEYMAAKTPDKNKVYLDGLETWRYKSVGISKSRDSYVLCRYADTPEPMIRRGWVLTFLPPIPIPGNHSVYVRCAGSPELVPIQVYRDADGGFAGASRFVRTWTALAEMKTESAADFDAVVERYKNNRPTELTEDVKVFKTRAEGAVRDKKFWQAADDYDRAVEAAPWWPQGRYNLAVIAAELQFYDLAIQQMGRYLKLVPTAENAEKAKQKIIEWKGKVRA